MLAGAGKARIELEGVLPFDGFGSAGDPLHVRAAVLQNPGGERSCLVSVDATSMRVDLPLRRAAAESAGCDQGDVWVTVTHTFSAPHVRTPGHLASDEERARNALLSERLGQAVRKACASAASALMPARFERAIGTCPINANRDIETPEGWWLGINPDGFSDHSVRAMRISAEGRPGEDIATLFAADVQPSTMQGIRGDDGFMLVSGDLVGEASRLLEERLGGVAIFLAGAAGDQAPRDTGPGAMLELGASLASEVARALAAPRQLEVADIRLERRTLSCPAQRRAEFRDLAPARDYAFVEDGTIDTVLSVARLGGLTVVGVEPEIDSALGSRLRELGRGGLEVLTMVNGAQKYLPSSDAYDRITYEAMNSSFARGADDIISSAILDLVKERP